MKFEPIDFDLADIVGFDNGMFSSFDNGTFSSDVFPVSNSLPVQMGALGSLLDQQQRDGDKVIDWYIAGTRNGWAHIWFLFSTTIDGCSRILESNTTIKL